MKLSDAFLLALTLRGFGVKTVDLDNPERLYDWLFFAGFVWNGEEFQFRVITEMKPHEDLLTALRLLGAVDLITETNDVEAVNKWLYHNVGLAWTGQYYRFTFTPFIARGGDYIQDIGRDCRSCGKPNVYGYSPDGMCTQCRFIHNN